MADFAQSLNSKQIYEHSNSDYPLAVYLIRPESSFLNNIPWHWHDEIEMDFVREGTASYSIGEETVCVPEGNAIFIKSNVFHKINLSDSDCSIVSLIFSPYLIFSSLDNPHYKSVITNFDRSVVFERSDAKGRLVIAFLEEILELNLVKSYGYELLTKSTLYQLWYYLVKDYPHSEITVKKVSKESKLSLDEERIKYAISYIHDNFADNISLDDIADSIHISKSECCRLFKRSIEMTPFEYLMRYRIICACDIMIQSRKNDESISYIAGSVGFNSASYFNKVFKEYIGCTPSEFKKQSKTERRNKLSPFGMSFSHI